MASLIYIDNNVEIKLSLLESFDWDFDQKYYKLKLKNILYFQNGRKVTAQNLEFIILRPFFAKPANIGSMEFVNLKGIEKIRHGQPYQSGLVSLFKVRSVVYYNPEKITSIGAQCGGSIFYLHHIEINKKLSR